MSAIAEQGFDTAAYTQTESLGDSTEPRAESDIYDCLIVGLSKNSKGVLKTYED